MNNKIWNYFEIAGKTAMSKNDSRSFILGAIAIRKDGVMVKALNSPTEMPNRQIHAEYRVSKKIDCGATIYVARIRLVDNKFGMARPCHNCMKILASKRVKKIYYTIDHDEFGIINLN
jgi:tRNA(Arg) A34 adenosine deaminase TadA